MRLETIPVMETRQGRSNCVDSEDGANSDQAGGSQ